MSFPVIPERLRAFFDQHTPGFWSWWQQAKYYFDRMRYDGDGSLDYVTNGNSHDHSGGDGAQIDHGGLAGLSDDDHSQYVLADGSRDIDFSSGYWNIGDVSNGNYTQIESDGTIQLVGDAIVYDDIRINPGSFDRPGVSDPVLIAYDVNGGGISTYLYEFAKNDIASFTVQIPHSYKTGENIKIHIHWSPGPRGAAESGNYVGWKIDYSWANIDGTFGTMATLDLSDVCDGTNHKHQMTPDISITGTGKGISSMLLCNIKRTDTGTDDTWAGTLTGELPLLLEIDIHYPINTIGSRNWGSK
jgi:hypothetical protein